MALTTHLADDVPEAIRRRGKSYFTGGTVRLLEGDAEWVEAAVRGSERYKVRLGRDGDTIFGSCTCPYYDGNLEVCKHMWAVLLAAEAAGYLKAPGGSDPRFLEPEDGDQGGREDDEYDEDEDDDDEEDDEDVEAFREAFRPPPRSAPRPTRPRPERKPSWKAALADVRGAIEKEARPAGQPWPPAREILYDVDVTATHGGDGLCVEVLLRDRKLDGNWSKPKVQRIPRPQIPRLPDAADREILALLGGAAEQTSYGYGSYGYAYGYYDSAPARYRLSEPQQAALLPRLCATGRCRLRRQPDEANPRTLRWDDGPPWAFTLELTPEARQYRLTGSLRRGDERIPLAAPSLLVAGGLAFFEDHAAALDDAGAFAWISLLRRKGALEVPAKQVDELLAELYALPRLPRVELPETHRVEEVKAAPRPRMTVRAPERRSPYDSGGGRLVGQLAFDYGGTVVPYGRPSRGVYDPYGRRLLVRDTAAEEAAAARAWGLGFRSPSAYQRPEPGALELPPRNLPKVIPALLADGWHVEAEGKLYRQPGTFRVEVRSGVDWFDLDGGVDFGDVRVGLPALLAAVRRGENVVRLDDGTFGMLPEEWLKKYGTLAGLGTVEGDRLRFTRAQVGLLDALLAAQPEASWDAGFAQARDALRAFDGVKPADPPGGFAGTLRAYQREGLGWLRFLPEFGFGGCLADDMGLGKTVQVLALLAGRRLPGEDGKRASDKPSLVVVPRSLVFNWKEEAARFAPGLRVLDHTGSGRAKEAPDFSGSDLVLTTYGTLRRDVLQLKEQRFDYCVLDEAQSVKNAASDSAKAVRLLRADHRLALSGTPVENHLGELWSLFEFLNPGMLGAASVFRLGSGAARNPSEETRSLLARALRPFILRRTKEQVARDLPQKSEQTIYCELEPAQRKQYKELRDYYRAALAERIERDSMGRSKIQVLEALLRLRQAACHPGLLDKAKTGEPSAKLDVLLPMLREVVDEGHKALVFSQFTTLLAVVRDRLDKEKVPYLYLDGRTRDRAARVERFQNDPDAKLFLISLKAGGLGLNLTAAEYVFLLDPWWNPAVEAQAVDRAHRIGQTRPVFAYRLIARDTVEEKVLALQQTKRALADAILNADNGLVRNLTREDLELLLS